MSINDTLKAKIDELDLDRRLGDLYDQAERMVSTALDKAGEFVTEHRDDVETWIDKASGTIDERTDGKFAEQVSKVRGTVETGVNRLAQRQDGWGPNTDRVD